MLFSSYHDNLPNYPGEKTRTLEKITLMAKKAFIQLFSETLRHCTVHLNVGLYIELHFKMLHVY